jgi:hypothetical protein
VRQPLHRPARAGAVDQLPIDLREGTCAAGNFTLAPAAFSPVITVPANASASPAVIAGAVTLNANAPTGCMGASLTEQVDGQASVVNS